MDEKNENFELFAQYSETVAKKSFHNLQTSRKRFSYCYGVENLGMSRIISYDFKGFENTDTKKDVYDFIISANNIGEKLIWFNCYPSGPEPIQEILDFNFIRPRLMSWTPMVKHLELNHLLTSISVGELLLIDANELHLVRRWSRVVANGFVMAQNKQEALEELVHNKSNINGEIFNFLYVVDGKDVSSCQIQVSGSAASIFWVSTCKEFQRRGFAQSMLIEVQNFLVTIGIKTLHLQSTPEGLRTYLGLGFQILGRIDLYLGKR